MTKKILVVDDDNAHAMMLNTLIRDWGYAVDLADDGSTAVEKVKQISFDLVLMDMKMVKMSGMDALQLINAYNPALPVIIMTAYSSVQTAVKALKIGAYDYLTKPLDFDRLKLTIDRLFEQIFLKTENQDLKARLEEKSLNHDIIGKSPAILALLDTIQMVAPTDANVLIVGESGTGKELVSSAIHYNSPRKHKPFVRINCAAITETLLESELFGHEKGAFTGADKKRKGKFLLADTGSILLDEIGEMSLPMQAKLLRVIQEKEITPVGSDENIRTDVRIIASTNKDLKKMSEQGEFRQDLYYRLNVVSVEIAPLRNRVEDIPMLALHFLTVFSRKNQRDIKGFTPEAMDAMIHHEWEGNVRELMNCVERGVVLARSDYIDVQQLPFYESQHMDFSSSQADLANVQLSMIEEKAIVSTLESCGGNKSEAARRLGITRKTLLKKLKQYEEKIKTVL
ncbi:MAG: sigma-54 dependent transcriptional regulator [Proteobacteria bacterium]|nr:sigma-54 dependent transcriptional regulator [Pseudomonadota bacterium]MBU1389064.1 sigma-54 dependent transcriptional regulator [Pseudomonadota bacterium]MBU1543617.1 sigma-54 dependent transcriptional regulator [Pseudomonadota bacterium]MBU2431344.1 sigma-54 dependent transcriptional regulator [Pseudomonadota bacterium]MBU2481967.1 sigma-54 dependent transcriptional regulator [Pseudomonadota bacterium]